MANVPAEALHHPADVVAVEPPKRRTLWRITDDLEALDDLIDELEGDVTDCELVIDEFTADLNLELNAKLDGYAAYIGVLNARSKARKEEADRLARRAKIDAAAADRLKFALLMWMRSRGAKKIDTVRHRISRCANGGKAPLVLVVDDSCLPQRPCESIPAEYRTETVVHGIDKEAIRKALEGGKVLDFAEIGERGEHLRIA